MAAVGLETAAAGVVVVAAAVVEFQVATLVAAEVNQGWCRRR